MTEPSIPDAKKCRQCQGRITWPHCAFLSNGRTCNDYCSTRCVQAAQVEDAIQIPKGGWCCQNPMTPRILYAHPDPDENGCLNCGNQYAYTLLQKL